MTRSPIDGSSNIKAIGYDASTSILEIEFHDGAVYQGEVPVDAHVELMAAESKGRHFHQHIKGRYPLRRGGVPAEKTARVQVFPTRVDVCDCCFRPKDQPHEAWCAHLWPESPPDPPGPQPQAPNPDIQRPG